MRSRCLTKSKVAMFEQCPRRLWLATQRPELAERDPGAEARLANGHEVGALACGLLPTGTMIKAAPDLSAAIERTGELLAAGHAEPIFGATLAHDGVIVRIDILEPDGAGGWRMAEVRRSISANGHHLGYLATQLWVARQAELSVSSAAIRHLDRSFVLAREGDFDGLFTDTERMAEAEPVIAERAAVIAAARATLGGPEPEIAPGHHCQTPFACEFSSHCHAALPEGPEWPVTILPNGGGKRWAALGIDDLLAIDAEALTNPLHRRVREATATGVPYHDPAGARAAMADWAYPRSWLDFETINFTVPRWVGTRPYQQVPFQFSVHVEQADGRIDHHEFLTLDAADPRRNCAEALLAALPPEGAVIGYKAAFERARIDELAEAFPDLAPRLRVVARRIVDLLPVTHAHWYHRDQRGSWSIKAVLPTIASELDYASLEVKDGGAAQEAFLEAMAPETSAERRRALELALKAYCARDTEAMIVLARRLAAWS